MTGSYEQIQVERRDRVEVVTLDRPDRLNAWTPRMMRELTMAIGAANDDAEVGAIVVTGAGRAFCAGADMESVLAGGTAGTSNDEVEDSAGDWVAFCRSSKPLVAAINGPAIGVGITMVLPFDQILATPTAKISVRFVQLGIVPELASTHFLVSRCGLGAASWLALSGETITGEAAAELRLVDRVVEAEALVDQAVTVAATLGASSPLALRLIKDLLTANAVDTDLGAIQSREFAALREASASPEHRAAIKAFLTRKK
jgi:enoyl-CoA hydratase/carnithine racemase